MSRGSSIGENFTVTTFGESHGPALGCVIDGCPAGLPLSEEDLIPFLDRRKPGQSEFATKRSESDTPEILSGIFEGRTTGTPIAVIIRNTDQRSGDYSELATCYRPGHADYTYDMKYGIRDHRGGGRSSGRETAARVAAGAVASKLLSHAGISIRAYTRAIGPVEIERMDPAEVNELCMPDHDAYLKAASYLRDLVKEGNSAGGIIECRIEGTPPGLGDPVFGKLSATLAHAVMSIGAVKGFEIGDGFAAAKSTGIENNDPFTVKDGVISKTSNHAGGILGGISDGSEIVIRAAVKPTPSVSVPQQTVTKDGEPKALEIKGRHDPVIVPRAVVVVESMAAIAMADALLGSFGSRLDVISETLERMKS